MRSPSLPLLRFSDNSIRGSLGTGVKANNNDAKFICTFLGLQVHKEKIPSPWAEQMKRKEFRTRRPFSPLQHPWEDRFLRSLASEYHPPNKQTSYELRLILIPSTSCSHPHLLEYCRDSALPCFNFPLNKFETSCMAHPWESTFLWPSFQQWVDWEYIAFLASMGKFTPGLRGTAKEIDAMSINSSEDLRFEKGSALFRKPLAAILTLGTGNSLGPEGPSVEVGMLMSRFCMPSSVVDTETETDIRARIIRNRVLLCAGAAAGVAAGFNAPLAGVFFALEIVQQSLPPLMARTTDDASSSSSSLTVPDPNVWFQHEKDNDFLSSGTGAITAVLLASVLSALVSQVFLGNHLALGVPSYQLNTPLIELTMYLLLGVLSGVVAGVFSFLAQLSKGFFKGEVGPSYVQETMTDLPKWSKPVIGGLTCGLVGLAFPQTLFFGYVTFNALLAKSTVMPPDLVLPLVFVKMFTTAIAAGSGLVGGTFAPALFLGGMGACFHDIVAQMIVLANDVPFQLADVQAYAIVGAAGVLSALFRAPLTASLLLFELTRDYKVLLPVLASAGVGSIVGDIVGKALDEVRRDRDAVSWGDLSDDDVNKAQNLTVV